MQFGEGPDGEGEAMQTDDTGGPEIIDGPPVQSDRPRMTTRFMTKYERARILGTRALQIRWACSRMDERC